MVGLSRILLSAWKMERGHGEFLVCTSISGASIQWYMASIVFLREKRKSYDTRAIIYSLAFNQPHSEFDAPSFVLAPDPNALSWKEK